MLYLKITAARENKNITTRQLSIMTGIRWNTIDDMEKNAAKHWNPAHLEKIMEVLEIERIEDLIEYKKEQEG